MSPSQKLQCQLCQVRRLSFCSVFDAAELLEHEAAGRKGALPANSVLFREGDPIDCVYNVTSGVLRLVRHDPNGKRRVLGFAIPGDFVGTVDDERHAYSAETAGPADVCLFPRKAFWDRMESQGSAFRAIHIAAMRSLDLAHDHIALLGSPSAEARVAGLIVSLHSRWSRLERSGSLVPMPMTRLDLADHLGLTISTVSRTLHRLQARGLIGLLPRAVRVRDADALGRLAAG